MATYLSTFTLVNLCLGIVTSALAYAVGLPNALLWGVLAGVLNYVAYLGPAVVTGPLPSSGCLHSRRWPKLQSRPWAVALLMAAAVAIQHAFAEAVPLPD